jgi:hypothetical protein
MYVALIDCYYEIELYMTKTSIALQIETLGSTQEEDYHNMLSRQFYWAERDTPLKRSIRRHGWMLGRAHVWRTGVLYKEANLDSRHGI